MGTRKLSNSLKWDREIAIPCCSREVSAMAASSAGKGRKRGPTLLDTHNDKSAAITTEMRTTESFAWINWIIEIWTESYQREAQKAQPFELTCQATLARAESQQQTAQCERGFPNNIAPLF